MRCSCCNKNLNDYESTIKDTNGGFLDTCKRCLKGMGIPVVGRPDLDPMEAAPPDEWFDIGDMAPIVDDPYFEDD